MRYPYTGVFVDHSGNIVSAGTISVFLQDTGAAANIYTASSGGVAVNSVISDSHGIFTFWVDDSTYGSDQLFKLVLTKTAFIEQTYENVRIYPFASAGYTETVKALALELAVSVGIYTGTGSPEGVTTANIGSVFLRKDGGANTSIYIKESGIGNTGWVAK